MQPNEFMLMEKNSIMWGKPAFQF